MFDIQGYSDNEQIRVAQNKSLTIDYYLAKQNPDIDFYKMQDSSSNWELVNEILEMPKPIAKDTLINIQEDVEFDERKSFFTYTGSFNW